MTAAAVERIRKRLGPVGVFGAGAAALAGITVGQERHLAGLLDRLGYGSLFIGEGIGGKDVFVRHGISLAETERLVLGSGVANIWARHARTMHAGAAALAEAYPDRFVLGMGVGHAFHADAVGGDFRPLQRMREYLDRMDAPVPPGFAEVASPAAEYARVLAAIGPRMLDLAAERTDGAYPFVQPVELTERARQTLGPDKLLVPHQGVLLTDDRAAGLAMATQVFDRIRRIPFYVDNYRRLGYTEQDIAGPSRRLVEAVFVVGDEDVVAARIREHLAAGADHVLISPIVPTFDETVLQLERLAPALDE